VNETREFLRLGGDAGRHRRDAERMLRTAKTPEDVLRWRLPHDFPPDIVYDGILRRQRLASVDPTDPRAVRYLAHALASIEAAARVVEREHPDLVVLSHVVNPQFAALAWFAVERGVPVVLGYGNYGVPRFVKIRTAADMREMMDCPTAADLATVALSRARALAEIGEAYLEKRRGGRTDDLGARYAFQRAGESVTRSAILDRFGWDPARPIVAVYASNWFDYPHTFGMTAFRDFLDWIEATRTAAQASTHVNWLFKAHPCDQWYGGVTLADLVPASMATGHVRLVPVGWNGSALLDAVDAAVTYFGTVGIEAAAAGKPVLVADRGWYHDAGFVRWPRSRGEYLEALATDWWKDLDVAAATHRARLFAGWYFGRPAWQQRFIFHDDTLQEAIWASLPELLRGGRDEITHELDLIQAWFDGDHRHYHTFKMSRAEAFVA
jgi:capsular polysaccharide biosynthesis protein